MYKIFTDGGTRNTGMKKGQHVQSTDLCAYAYLIVDTKNNKKIIGSQAFTGLTNNQMEGMALNMALFRLEALISASVGKKLSPNYQIGVPFEVVADSRYVINYASDPKKLAWKIQNKPKMPNKDVWKMYLREHKHFPNLTFHWVKGHAVTKGNIFVDHLLNKMMDRKRAGETPYMESKSD